MLVILGCIVVTGSVLGGFMMVGGEVGALIQINEFVTIGGASLGAMIIMSPAKTLIDLFKGILQTLTGSPYGKKAYTEVFKLTYELLRVARRDGLLALEPHLNDPHSSAIFNKYPTIAKNHHTVTFICDGFAPLIESSASPEMVKELMEAELQIIEVEHHNAVGVLQKTADGLPGFGIVAAVLGIVVTMAAINGPVEEIGHHVGSALVGTFLGILVSYGFLGPLASRMELLGSQEMNFYRTISTIIIACTNEATPKGAIEQARRGVGSEFRPARAALDALFKEADAA